MKRITGPVKFFVLILFISSLNQAETAETRLDIPSESIKTAGNQVITGKARFTVLTPEIIRMEWVEDGRFEDRASFVFINRDLPVPVFSAEDKDGWVVIETPKLVLKYKRQSGTFTSENLEIRLKDKYNPITWKPGKKETDNLGGTVRTLDGAAGAVPLDGGILSRDGWVLIDDSETLLFGENGWVETRKDNSAIDWYFMGYGHNYKKALLDYTKLTGRIPLPPRWSFGSWWSRYWAYTGAEFKDLVRQYREHDVPLDVLVIDMDWHLDGWTGYTWNPDYFPEPEEFLKWCHDQGLKTTLNLHPHDGVKKHEADFPEFAEAMGLDPDKTGQIPFDCADPKYMKAYFDILHHPKERQGVDFWWIDWQQGEETKVPGLDPLFWLNHLHWKDMAENPEREDLRPMIFSRWGGLGNHRYQIGFSGDTYCNWESLAFQPYFTATAGNVCYPFWSHDIGGHQPGPVDGEIYARWIQFAAFNPFLRTHTTKNSNAERRIWEFSEEVFEASKAAFKLRYRLLPYIYTTARECYDTALPMNRPLYYDWPELDEAYEYTGEYMFGSQLLVAPVTGPRERTSNCAVSRVWFPPGEWHHWFTGKVYEGPAVYTLMTPLDQIPVFAKAGAIIPTIDADRRRSVESLNDITFHVFPGESGSFVLYEDDGESRGYEKNEYLQTPVSMKTEDGMCEVTIGPSQGSYKGMPGKRERYNVVFHNICDVPEKSQEFRDVSFTGQINAEANISVKYSRLIRRGYKGKMDYIGELENTLNNDQFEKIENMFFGKEGKKLITALPSKTEKELIIDWKKITEYIYQNVSDEKIKTEILMRMLGMAAEFKLIVNEKAIVVSMVSVEFPYENSIFDVDIETGIPAGFKPVPEQSLNGILNSNGKYIKVDEYKPGDSLNTSELKAIVKVFDVAVPLRKTILPSINSWWIIGPFDNPWANQLETVFPPEREFDRGKVYKGKDGEDVKWQKAVREIKSGSDLGAEFLVDLNKEFKGEFTDTVAYARTHVYSPADIDAVLALGTDDGVAAWLNGDEIHRNPAGRPYTAKEDRIPIKLKKGRNELLLKISQGTFGWEFCGHLETPAGLPLTSMNIKLD